MKPAYPKFNPDELSARIDEYFIQIKGKSRNTRVPVKNAATKTVSTKLWDREPEPATITGLALFLGFNSLDDFDRYLEKGRFAKIISRAKLRIQSIYEQKLHDHYTSGPIFVLKTLLGWNEDKGADSNRAKTLNIKITESGPAPAASEKEVMIENETSPTIQNTPITNEQ